MTEKQVVLVDKDDRQIGMMGKLAAHQGKGMLHRAISVLLYRIRNGETEMLLQKRGKEKPLWPLFWSNTICTHPRDGETYVDCALRRLIEEMDIFTKKEDLNFVFRLKYHAQYDEEFSEYELDSVFVGQWDEDVSVDHNEVDSYMWMEIGRLTQDLHQSPGKYTPWFLTIMEHPCMKTMFKKEII